MVGGIALAAIAWAVVPLVDQLTLKWFVRDLDPVRVGNQAAQQVQNDVYGSAVLAATHVFFDRRLARQGNAGLFAQLERLGERAASVWSEPDAGLWELRGSKLGRREEARALFEKPLGCGTRLGLLAEHIDPVTHELWGNFPQTYSMVGLIDSATRLSILWDGAFKSNTEQVRR